MDQDQQNIKDLLRIGTFVSLSIDSTVVFFLLLGMTFNISWLLWTTIILYGVYSMINIVYDIIRPSSIVGCKEAIATQDYEQITLHSMVIKYFLTEPIAYAAVVMNITGLLTLTYVAFFMLGNVVLMLAAIIMCAHQVYARLRFWQVQNLLRDYHNKINS